MVTRLRDSEAIAALRVVAIETPDREITFRQNVTTNLTGHHLADEAYILALGKGLTANKTTSGGWFTKAHLLTVEGSASRVLEWYDEIIGWL